MTFNVDDFLKAPAQTPTSTEPTGAERQFDPDEFIGGGQQAPVDEGFDFEYDKMKAVMNDSAKANLFAQAQMYAQPMETVKQMIDLAKHPMAAVNAFVDRWHSVDAIQQQLQEHPIQFFSEALSLLSLGTKAAARTPGLKSASRSLMDRSTSFPSRLGTAKRAKHIETMFREKVPKTTGGTNKVAKIAGAINDEIDDLILRGKLTGDPVPVSKLRTHIDKLINKVTKEEFGPDWRADIDILEDMRKEMNISFQGKTHLPADAVQAFKKRQYDRINWDRKNSTADLTRERGRKALGRSAREEVANLDQNRSFDGSTNHPWGVDGGIEDLNKRQGPLLDLQDDLDRSVAGQGNKLTEVIKQGMSTAIGGGVGTAFGGPGVGTAVGAGIGHIMGGPGFQSRAALMMQRLMDAGHSEVSAMLIAQGLANQASQLGQEDRSISPTQSGSTNRFMTKETLSKFDGIFAPNEP